MNNNRRDFLKKTGLAGFGLVGGSLFGLSKSEKGPYPKKYRQKFNMHDYAST